MSYPVYSGLMVACVLFAIALLTLQAAPRRSTNRFFAFFLLLVAANFGAGFANVYIGSVLDSPEAAANASFVGLLFLVLDPAILLYFASVFPRRRWLARSTRGGLALLAVPAVLYVATFRLGREADVGEVSPYRLALFAYLAFCYLVSLGLIVSAWLGEKDPGQKGTLRVLVIAFAVAIAPRIGAITADLGYDINAWSFVLTGLVLLAVFASSWALDRNRSGVGRAAAWTLGFTLLVVTPWIPILLATSVEQVVGVYTYRWFVFGGLVSYAILRHQVFDIDVRFKRGASVAIAAAILVAAFFLAREASRWLAPAWPSPFPAAAGILAAVAAIVPAVRAARIGARFLLPGVVASEAYLHQRKLEVYTSALAAALEEGRDPGRDAELADLRRKLGLAAADVRELRSLAESEVRFGGSLSRALRKGSLLRGRYRIGDQIGAGRFGRAYAATDESTGERVVIKELRPEWRGDDGVRKRFQNEAKVLHGVRSPHVVRLREAFDAAGAPCLVLDYLEGGNLEARLARGPLPVPQAVRVAREILLGLEALHERGVVHRDVKPSNVLFDGTGRAVLSDLGVAHAEPTEELTVGTMAGAQPGTLRYMSPEQARGDRVDARSDIYAVGAVLYEMLSGRPPVPLRGLSEFAARRALQERRPRLPLHEAGAELNQVLAKALQPDRRTRFATARAMRAALGAASGLGE